MRFARCAGILRLPLVVILTLGFGIGINTATFSIVNAALIRPLGFAEPERLVALHEHLRACEDVPFSPPDFLDLERDQQSFEGVAAYVNVPFELSGRGEPIRIDGAKVSAKLFSLLGVRPLVGRDFRRRRGPARYGRGGAELGSLAIALRRRPLDRRPDRHARPPALYGDRRHAGELRVPPPRPPVEQQAGQHLGADGVHRRTTTGTRQPVQSQRDWQAEARRVHRRSPSGARCPGTTDQCQLSASCCSTRASRSACPPRPFGTRSSGGWSGRCCCCWRLLASCSS